MNHVNNRLRPVSSCLALLFGASIAASGAACSEDGSGLDAGAADAGPALPDARVLPSVDSGAAALPEPTVTRVSPAVGPTAGGTRVTIRGTAFLEPAEVFFGAEPAASVAVLDEGTVAATTPPGSLGAVSLRIVTAGGAAELPNAFTYVRELRLDAVAPVRVPDEGGVELTLTGKGFTPETVVLVDRVPLRGLSVSGEERMSGYLPELPVGRPEIRVVTEAGAVRRSDLLVVFGTPDVDSLAPGHGPITGGAAQELAGEGFGDASAVLFGGVSGTGLELRGDARLQVGSPVLSEGIHDVVVENADARGTAPGAFIAYDPGRGELHVLGATPPRLPAGTAAVLTVVGGGFGSSTQVALDGRRLSLRGASANAVEVELPGDLTAGSIRLEVTDGVDSAVATVEIYDPITIAGIEPLSGPAAGGTSVTVRGSNFEAGMDVRIAGVALENVQVLDAGTLTGRTVAGAHGPQDVTVRGANGRARLAGGFSFVEPFDIVRIEPNEGSIAGNTYVSIIGRGFDAPVAVRFGAEAGLQPQLENGSVAAVRAPPGAPGTVDLAVEMGGGQESLPQAYSYFDPRLLAGGAWGGPIEGAVNVAVLDNGLNPLANMTVQLGDSADPAYRGVTDANGLATISSPEIRGAQTVTVGGERQEFVTFADIDARNLTMISAGHPQVAPPDAPVSPCPEGQQPPVVRGRIFELKSATDPVSNPDVVPVVRITYTQSNVFSPNPVEPPEQFDFVFQEGEQYEIVVMRAGVVAVYAVLGDFNQTTQEFVPRRMGIARGIPVAPETITSDVDIALDIEMNQTLRVRLDNPPNQNPGPSLSAVFPFLNLESDGVIPFDAAFVESGGELVLRNMPALAESQFFYMGGSFTGGATGLASPYSLTLVESSAEAEEGVDLGPYLEMPTNVRPKAGELLTEGRLTWDQGGPVPDLATLSVVDVGAAGGQCCIDLNMNGQCDEGEPLQGGALPVQFNRWSLYAEGGSQSYELPRMPLDVQAFEPPRAYSYLLQLALAPRFSWREFAYNQFSPFFWQSWVVWSSSFTVKEETD